VFTDIEGSTRRWEADADAMAAALEAHDEAMRGAVTSCGGVGYESLARTGADMTNAGITAYVFDQLDRARAEVLASD